MFVLITPKVLKSRSAVAKRQMQPESSKCDTVCVCLCLYITVVAARGATDFRFICSH